MSQDEKNILRLAALIARAESPEVEEARTSAVLAIKLMRKLGMLPEDLLEKVEKLKAPVNRISRAGGVARAQKLSPERRKEIARQAAASRWRKRDISRCDPDACQQAQTPVSEAVDTDHS